MTPLLMIQSLHWTSAPISHKPSSRVSTSPAVRLHCSKTGVLTSKPRNLILTFTYRTPKKPKSKKMVSLATAISAKPDITNESASIAVPGVAGTDLEENGSVTKHEESDERIGQKRKRYVTIVENGKKRKIIDQVLLFLKSIPIS